jgi:hypothetical protein
MKTVAITVDVPVVSLTAEEIEARVIERVAAQVLGTDIDDDGEVTVSQTFIKHLREQVREKVESRIIAQVDAIGPTLVSDVLNAEFQPMTTWGDKSGPPTTIRAMVFAHAKEWLTEPVQPDGSRIQGYYNGTRIHRLQFLVRSEVESWFKKEAAAEVAKMAAEVKPVMAQRLSAAVGEAVTRALGLAK